MLGNILGPFSSYMFWLQWPGEGPDGPGDPEVVGPLL